MLEEIDSQRALGAWVRANVLPAGMSVKEAAQRLGVGRPALSNFLNGRAALSADMATRLDAMASAACEVLAQVSTVPGNDADGHLNAEDVYRWVAEVRTICATHARADTGDYVLGELLARGPFDPDGTRPGLPVSEVLERIASKRMAEGYYIETHNARETHWRGEGGAQVREIAARFRLWASRRAYEFPFVAALLDELARSYEREAETHDTETALDRRLRGWWTRDRGDA